ncbi:MAG: hypothetical protein HY808_16360 [Nitrospirae bacterium]|nr:hypothetical protein [Nitrospirota bacterium]
MRLKSILVFGVIVSLFVCPLVAAAESVTWSSTYYEVAAQTAYIDENGDKQPIWYTRTGPPLPIEVSAAIPIDPSINASASIPDASTLFSGITISDEWLRATAIFSGSFIVTQPFFLLDYNYTESSISNSAVITIKDTTSGLTLYDRTINLSENGTLNINTSLGDTISVYLSTSQTQHGGSSSLTYSTSAVAPEPISSILFVIGGATLAGRRLLKRGRV